MAVVEQIVRVPLLLYPQKLVVVSPEVPVRRKKKIRTSLLRSPPLLSCICKRWNPVPLCKGPLVGQEVARRGVVRLVQRLRQPQVGGLVQLEPGPVYGAPAPPRPQPVPRVVDADELEGPLGAERAGAVAVVGEEADLVEGGRPHGHVPRARVAADVQFAREDARTEIYVVRKFGQMETIMTFGNQQYTDSPF